MATQLPGLDRFSLQVTIYIQPENVAKFFQEFKPIFEKVWAEPECVYFEVFQDAADPGKISWIENWDKSPEWFMKVLASHVSRYRKSQADEGVGTSHQGVLQGLFRGDGTAVCQAKGVPNPQESRPTVRCEQITESFMMKVVLRRR